MILWERHQTLPRQDTIKKIMLLGLCALNLT
nr:MAG TPA: hypothetical protein [Caudoviricetes sp.]